MLEITLLKTLYHEINEDTIDGVRVYDNEDASKYHEIDMEIPGFPEIKSLTAEVCYGSHNSSMYYVHLNGNVTVQEDIHDPAVKAAIYHFFKTYRPEFFKDNLPEDIREISILDCLDIAKLPDYRPKYAFPGIVTMEDIKNGPADKTPNNKPSFPGLRMLMGGTVEERKDDRPVTVSNDANVKKFDEGEDVNDTLEKLKKQFNIDTLLNK